MVLFDHLILDQPSLQQHSLNLFKELGRKVSKQGLDKRFNANGVAFIQALFAEYLNHQLNLPKLPSDLEKHFSAIRLMDSTEFKLPSCLSEAFPGFGGDGTNSCTQIQFEYDILSAKIQHLAIENARNPDHCYANDHLEDIQPGNLIIRDLGYNTIDIFKTVEAKGAYYISRLNANMIIYEKRNSKGFKPLTFKSIVTKLKKSTKKYLDIPIYIGKQAKHPVRLIANLLDDASRQIRCTKKIYRKTKQKEKYKYLSQLNLFLTNISKSTLSPEKIYGLYRVRWQIELAFKTWKSVLKIDHVRKMKADRFKCYLIGKLLWIMISWDICTLFNVHVLKNKNHLLSLFKCFSILKQCSNTFKAAIARKEKIKEWLDGILLLISEFGLKEFKKGKTNLLNLLSLK